MRHQMRQDQSAKILQIHISEADRFEGKPLYEAVVAKCREMKIAGATVFRGLEGYGETAEIERRPIVIIVVDTAENIDRLKPVIERMMTTGMIAVSDADMIRVHRA